MFLLIVSHDPNAHVFILAAWTSSPGKVRAVVTLRASAPQVCSSPLFASDGGHAGGCSDGHSVLHHDLLLQRLPAFGVRAL